MTRAWRSWNGPARLHGVDLARALAVFGMLAAHLLPIEDELDLAVPATWIDVVNGRSSILFAVLAGVSIALVTGGRTPHRGIHLRVDRRRLAVRALALWAIGLALMATGVPVYVILPAYGILFLLAAPLVALPVAALWSVAIVIALVVPWVLPLVDAAGVWEGEAGEALFLAFGWAYPFPLWIAFVLVGIALGRTDLRRAAVAGTMLAGGAAAAALASIVALAVPDAGTDPYLEAVLSGDPHSSGIVEAIGSAGVAVAVLGLCLLVCRTPATWVLAPLRAVGAMPLTAYVGQILVWAVAALVLVGDPSDLWSFRAVDPFWWFAVGAVVFCTLWGTILGQGPLERLLAAVVRRVVPAAPPTAADRVDG